LKPKTILLSRSNSVKVSDFSLCGTLALDRGMQTFCGSPCYCAPECIDLVEYEGPLADVWSVGVILFAMVTGAHPWYITNTTVMVTQIRRGPYTCPPHVLPKCRALIQGMVMSEPVERFTMEQVLMHLWLDCAQMCKYSFGEALVRGVPKRQIRPLDDLGAEAAAIGGAASDGIVTHFRAE
jgi:serine/threonine protein kinase